MNKKTLYIHIGVHKTGSTTIQSILEEEKRQLLDEEILYLGLLKDIPRTIITQGSADKQSIRGFQQEIQAQLDRHQDRNIQTVIASNEKFAGDNMAAYKNARTFAETLWQTFEPFGFHIKIIVYLRRQDKFFESLYTQRIKRGASYSFQEYLDLIDDIYDLHWTSLLDTFANTFGEENIITKRFGKEYLPHKDDLIQGFGTIIQSDLLKNYSSKVVKNKGFSRDMTEIIKLSNRYLTEEEKSAMRKIFRMMELPKGNRLFFTLEERKKLLAHYQESNSKTTKKYLKDSTGRLFSTSDLENEELQNEYNGLTPEMVAVTFIKMILALDRQLNKEIEETRKMNFTNRVKRKLRQIFGQST